MRPGEKTKRALCRNPRRSCLMAGLIGVTIILLGRTLLNGPATAPAMVIPKPTPIAEPRQNNSALLDWLAQPSRPLQRNLFGSTLATSTTEPSYQPQTLELQTTVMEDPPRAMINGELVQEGDVVDGFTILKIQPRKVIVQQNGAAVEIDMP